MKLKHIFFLSALSLAALSSCRDHLTGPNTPTVSDTIAYWTFDGTTTDVSGHGHNAIVQGIFDYAYPNRFGQSNKSIEFVGTNILAVQSMPNFSDNDSYTISMWVNFTQDGSMLSQSYSFAADPSGFGAYLAGCDSIMSNTPLGSEQWHLVTLAVAAHSSASIYIDSVLTVVKPYGSYTGTNDSIPLTIFFNQLGFGDTTRVDDALFLNRCMTSQEVWGRFHEGGWYEHHDTVTIPPVVDSVWTPVNTGTTQSLVVGQFVNGANGFVSGVGGVFLGSNDSGATWQLKGTAPTLYGGNTIYGVYFFNATTGFSAGDQRVISRTTDGGNTWQQMDASNLPQTDLIRSLTFTNQQTGFVGTSDAYAAPSGTICESNDGGQTWNPIFTTHGGIYEIDFNSATNNMTGVAMGRFGVDYWTTDGGSTWHPGSTGLPNALISRSTWTSATVGFAVASDLNSTNGYVLKTTDAGHTWSVVQTVTSGLHGIASNGAGTITAVGENGIVVESMDAGATWSQSTAGSVQWNDVRYAGQHRAVLFGVNGAIDMREK